MPGITWNLNSGGIQVEIGILQRERRSHYLSIAPVKESDRCSPRGRVDKQ